MSDKVVKRSSKPRGRKISKADWEGHRDRILQLWLKEGEDGKTLDDIVEVMRKEHNFVATASQYHNRIVHKWFVRKNVTKAEWRKLYWNEFNRKSAGESTGVLFNGQLVPEEKKRREWERYSFASEHRPEGLSPLPEAFEYRPLDIYIESAAIAPKQPTEITALTRTSPIHVSRQQINVSTNLAITSGNSLHIIPGPVSASWNTTHPFFWSAELDWTNLTRILDSDRQIIRMWKPDLNQLNAMYYSQHQSPLTIAKFNDSFVPQHLLSCMLNGISYSESYDLSSVYHWLAQMPRRPVLDFFQSLPTESLDIICHRILVAAKSNKNVDTVRSILGLEYDLRTSTPYTEDDVIFMLDALGTFGSPAIETIVEYASRISQNQDLVLSLILQKINHFVTSVRTSLLMWIPLKAGAVPTMDCLIVARYDTTMLDELFVVGKKSIFDWLREGLLTTAVNMVSSYEDPILQRTLIEWILSLLKGSIDQSMWTNFAAPAVSLSLAEALKAALSKRLYCVTATIYNFCSDVGHGTNFYQMELELNSTVMQALRNEDWDAAHEAFLAARTLPTPSLEISSGNPIEKLKEAVRAQDFHLIRQLMNIPEYRRARMDHVLEFALDTGFDNAAALIATCRVSAIIRLLESGSIRVINILLCQYSHWDNILQKISYTNAYDDLDDWLYRRRPHEYCDRFPCCLPLPDLYVQQVLLRVLSYYAIYRSDIGMLDWLCDRGLATERISVGYDEYDLDDVIFYGIGPALSQNGKFVSDSNSDEQIRLPSLLDVAIQQRDLGMITYFLDRRPKYRDSNALLHAIKSKSEPALVQTLLQDRSTGDAKDKVQYGSAALRVAIRDHAYELVRQLAEATDIHGLERIEEKEGCLDYVDPLGESILRDDCTAVKILLDAGGDPNAVVVFDGLDGHTPRSANISVLSRMTALLVAIDVGSLSMVQCLVQNGASVNRESNMGLLRTPLQRAAEIGDFQLVKYLLEQKAVVDTAPVYGGGTALQLAAMSGHVGIAALLIEHGANVNYPPAKGPGRTAFEAAAEWCRPDMMHLLVQHGVQLDLKVTEEVDEKIETEDPGDLKLGIDFRWHTVRIIRTQYERAIQFAQDRGEHASKRIVERLGRELLGNQNNSFPSNQA